MRDFSKKHKRIFKRGTTNGVDDVALISRLYHGGSGYSGGGGGGGGPFFFQRDETLARAGPAFCFCVGQISSLSLVLLDMGEDRNVKRINVPKEFSSLSLL